MKRPLQLSLAIALALSGTDALALGLGTIHVNSKLNQPLDAEIPVLQGTQGEAEGLLVQLAAAEDFDRVGLNRSRLSVPLEFSVIKGSRGDLMIKVTSKEVIREPFLDFLVEANWPKGRLLREYTVLLDPPVMAPATGTAAVATAAKTPERAPTQPLPEAKPKAPAKPAPAPPVAAAPRAAPAPSKPAPTTPEPKRTAASGEYTVEAGDTLSGIARDVRTDESTNVNQLMLALLKQNPNAFYKDNINALKRGSILRIPSADQVKAVGSASEAAATVHQQIEDWRGGTAAKPTLIADTGTPTPPPSKTPAAKTTTSTSTSTASKTPSERLELVPPKAGKDSVAMADRPGSGAGSGGNSAELKSELARTKEALTSREQEAGELKSRVKELEDTKGKTDRLITLKDSEIADLQRKLKDLQSGTKTTAATPPATSTTPTTTSTTTPATTTTTPATGAAAKGDAAKVSKEDIWGTASPPADTSTSSTTPSSTTGTTSPTSTTPSTTGSTTTTTPSAGTSTTPSTASTTTPGTTTPSATGTTTGSTTPADTTSGSTTPPTSSTTTPPSSTSDSTTTASTTPSASGESSSTSSSTTTPTTKPAATTAPVKATAMSKTQPLAPTGSAWYEQSWVKPAAIGAGALLLLAGLLGMRKRRVPAVERGSIAGAFGDTPLRGEGGAVTASAEEESLRDQLMQDPSNLGLHLELLSLLYAERNIDAFEDAAYSMHAQVIDPQQPEWLEARAMGQELAPHNPLFYDATPAEDIFDDEAVTAPHALQTFDHDDVFKPREADVEPARATTSAFDFDLDAPPPSTLAAPPPASEAAFAFESLPPIDFGAEAHRELESAIAPAPLPVDDEFPGDDGVGTKLDLAKAYLDMGDPEGARSMLEEVLAEGNDTQKGEARKLMAEIR